MKLTTVEGMQSEIFVSITLKPIFTELKKPLSECKVAFICIGWSSYLVKHDSQGFSFLSQTKHGLHKLLPKAEYNHAVRIITVEEQYFKASCSPASFVEPYTESGQVGCPSP